MTKIIICGLNGSGKTTLGKKLSELLEYVHKDIEDYYFNNNNSYKYSSALSKDDVIKRINKDFDKYDNLIFTACKGEYGNISDKIDLAIYINLDKNIRLQRVKERSYNLFGDRILENGDLYEKENEFFDMVYNKDENLNKKWFNDLKCNKIEIDGMLSVEENAQKIMEIL